MRLYEVIKNISRVARSKLNGNNAYKKCRLKNSRKQNCRKNSAETFFDGMGPDTATEIIKRRIDKYIINEYGIYEFENKGRYYIARVCEANGSILHTLLVDKQTGMTRTLCRKAVVKDLY
jgi:hypothetical protein